MILISCGGGGGSNNDSGDTPSETDIVNPGMSGKIFIGNRFGPWLLDLASGRYTKIPGTNWGDDTSSVNFTAYPVAYGDGEYIETVEDCVLEFGNNRDCIVFHDAAGMVTSQFEIAGSTFGPARLSRDSQAVAVLVDRDSAPFKVLDIYRRDGTFVTSSASFGQRVENHDFDWIVKNAGPEVIYINGQSIYDSTNPTNPIITIDASLGVPGEPSVSPDSNQIAFTIAADRSSTGIEGTIWVVNSDGSGLRQLTDASPGQESIVGHRSPVWSPDGQLIFVNDRTTIDGTPYIVSAEAEKVVLTQDASTTAVPIFSFFDETRDLQNSDDPIDLEATFLIRAGSLAWLP